MNKTRKQGIFILMFALWSGLGLFSANLAVAQNQLPAWALGEGDAADAIEVPATSSQDLSMANTSEDREYTVEELKQQMLELNRDLLILEEELLFPASTQISVFLSMDVGAFFQLDSVRLEIDGEEVAAHLYTERQLDALHRGGVQRLHLGNIRSGQHEVVAYFTGSGTHDRDYKRAASIEIEKTQQPLMLELVIKDSEQNMQPNFYFDTWSL